MLNAALSYLVSINEINESTVHETSHSDVAVLLVVESMPADQIGRPSPTRLISLTENDTCSSIADFPATTFVGPPGVISDGKPTYCGGNAGDGAGVNQCWSYDKWSDSWSQGVSINVARYAHTLIKISHTDFAVVGECRIVLQNITHPSHQGRYFCNSYLPGGQKVATIFTPNF